MEDKYGFLSDVSSWTNYRPFLFAALLSTTGPVLELGMGHGSTPILHEFCKDTNRLLCSWDSDPAWVSKFTSFESPLHKVLCCDGNWDNPQIDLPPSGKWSVVLIDHAPGERRKVDIERLAHKAEIIIAHDTEPDADGGYKMQGPLNSFLYKAEFVNQIAIEGAWSTMVSNTINVRDFMQKELKAFPNIQ
jgi:hypothetical protein